MIEFLSGAVTAGYLVAAGFFARYWARTGERLFLAFAAAFVLFAVNQALAPVFQVVNEPTSLIYALRIVGFFLIIAAIVDKNLGAGDAGPLSRVLRRK